MTEEQIKKYKDCLNFRNEILGSFDTQEELNKAIEESGIIKRNGVYFVPTEQYTYDKTIKGQQKAGETYSGVAQKFLNYKRSKLAIED